MSSRGNEGQNRGDLQVDQHRKLIVDLGESRSGLSINGLFHALEIFLPERDALTFYAQRFHSHVVSVFIRQRIVMVRVFFDEGEFLIPQLRYLAFVFAVNRPELGAVGIA